MSATHGIAGTYSAGCRCEKCKAANRVRMQEVRQYLSQKPWNEVPHGTTNGYSNYCCRCDDCRAAAVTANHRQRLRRIERMKAGDIPDYVVHGWSCYTGWSCRCDICKAGERQRRKRRAEAKKRAAWAQSRPIQT